MVWPMTHRCCLATFKPKPSLSTELELGRDLIGLTSIDPGRRVKSYASAELEFGHDVIGVNPMTLADA
jgi:hypothetical protein